MTGRRIEGIGPVTYDGVVIVQGNTLRCVDPISGVPFWVRHDISPQSTAFGDDEIVIVTKTSDTDSRVFRMIDGRELERRSVPQNRWGTIGSRVVAWDENSDNWIVRLFDPMTGRDEWQHSFPPDSRGHLDTENGLLAIIDPDGHFSLIESVSGEMLIKFSMEESKRRLNSVQLLTSNEQIIVVRDFKPVAQEGTTITSFSGQHQRAAC